MPALQGLFRHLLCTPPGGWERRTSRTSYPKERWAHPARLVSRAGGSQLCNQSAWTFTCGCTTCVTLMRRGCLRVVQIFRSSRNGLARQASLRLRSLCIPCPMPTILPWTHSPRSVDDECASTTTRTAHRPPASVATSRYPLLSRVRGVGAGRCLSTSLTGRRRDAGASGPYPRRSRT